MQSEVTGQQKARVTVIFRRRDIISLFCQKQIRNVREEWDIIYLVLHFSSDSNKQKFVQNLCFLLCEFHIEQETIWSNLDWENPLKWRDCSWSGRTTIGWIPKHKKERRRKSQEAMKEGAGWRPRSLRTWVCLSAGAPHVPKHCLQFLLLSKLYFCRKLANRKMMYGNSVVICGKRDFGGRDGGVALLFHLYSARQQLSPGQVCFQAKCNALVMSLTFFPSALESHKLNNHRCSEPCICFL